MAKLLATKAKLVSVPEEFYAFPYSDSDRTKYRNSQHAGRTSIIFHLISYTVIKASGKKKSIS